MHINIEHAAIAPTRRALARPACGRPSSIERSGRARKLNRTPAHGRETTRPPHSCSFGNCCGRLRFVGVAFGRRRHRPHRRRGAFAPGAFAPHAALGAALGAAAALGVAKLLSKAAARRAALGGRVACERERGRSRGRRRRVLERSSRLVQFARATPGPAWAAFLRRQHRRQRWRTCWAASRVFCRRVPRSSVAPPGAAGRHAGPPQPNASPLDVGLSLQPRCRCRECLPAQPAVIKTPCSTTTCRECLMRAAHSSIGIRFRRAGHGRRRAL